MALPQEMTDYLSGLNGDFRSIQKLVMNLVSLKKGHFPYMLFQSSGDELTQVNLLTLKSFTRLIQVQLMLIKPEEKKGGILNKWFGHDKTKKVEEPNPVVFKIKFEIQKNLNEQILDYQAPDTREISYQEDASAVLTVLAELHTLRWIPESVWQSIQDYLPAVANAPLPEVVQSFFLSEIPNPIFIPFDDEDRSKNGEWLYTNEYDIDYPEPKMSPQEYRRYLLEEKFREEADDANEQNLQSQPGRDGDQSEDEFHLPTLESSLLTKKMLPISNPLPPALGEAYYTTYSEKYKAKPFPAGDKTCYNPKPEIVLGIDQLTALQATLTQLATINQTVQNIPEVFGSMRHLAISIGQNMKRSLTEIMEELKSNVDLAMGTSQRVINDIFRTSDEAMTNILKKLTEDVDTFFTKNIVAKLNDFIADWDKIQSSFILQLSGLMSEQKAFHNDVQEQINHLGEVATNSSQAIAQMATQVEQILTTINEHHQQLAAITERQMAFYDQQTSSQQMVVNLMEAEIKQTQENHVATLEVLKGILNHFQQPKSE